MALLASLLLKNRNDVGGWLLMGELIDDPARKRDCDRRVLRLSPDHLQALAKLQELEQSLPFTVPVTGTESDQAGGERPVNESMTRS